MITKALIGSAIVSLAVATATPAAAGGDDHGQFPAPAFLAGSWQVRITPYVCGSNPIVSFPERAFDSLLTFAAGGTVTETTANPNFQPGQRSPGHGYWSRVDRRSYDAVLQAFIQFTAGSYTRGTQLLEQEIELVDADHWTSTAVVTFRNAQGDKVPPSGCATAAAVRMP
jgi:hypothetical protein